MLLPSIAANRRRRVFVGLYALLLTIGLCWPLLGPGFYDQHEGLSYMLRLNALADGWHAQGTHPRWSPELAGGHGYPLFNFYPPGFSYLALTFYPLGSLTAVKLTVLLATFLGVLCIYGLGRSLYGFEGGLVAATLAATAPYTLCNLHTRGDFSEYVAFYAAAGVLWTLLRALRRRVPWGPALGFAAAYGAFVPLHTISSLVYSALFAVIACALGLKARFGARTWARLLVAFTGGLMLSAWYWLPALTEKHLVATEQMLEGAFVVEDHFAQLPRYFTGLSRSVPVLGPLITLALAAAAVLALRSRRRALPLTLVSLAALCIVLNFALSRPFWQQAPLVRYIQFPWRLNGPVVLLVTVALVASLQPLLRGRLRIAASAGAVLLALVTVAGLAVSLGKVVWLTPEDSELRASVQRWTTTSVRNEFLPKAAVDDPTMAGAPLIVTEAELLRGDIDGTTLTAEIESATGTTVSFRQWAHPGWTSSIDGQPAQWQPDTVGRLSLRVPAGRHALQVKLERTGIQRSAEWISLATLALMLGMVAARSVRRGVPKSEKLHDPGR